MINKIFNKLFRFFSTTNVSKSFIFEVLWYYSCIILIYAGFIFPKTFPKISEIRVACSEGVSESGPWGLGAGCSDGLSDSTLPPSDKAGSVATPQPPPGVDEGGHGVRASGRQPAIVRPHSIRPRSKNKLVSKSVWCYKSGIDKENVDELLLGSLRDGLI